MAATSGRVTEERRQPGTRAMQGQGRRRVVPAGGRRGRQLSRRHPVHRLGNYITAARRAHYNNITSRQRQQLFPSNMTT